MADPRSLPLNDARTRCGAVAPRARVSFCDESGGESRARARGDAQRGAFVAGGTKVVKKNMNRFFKLTREFHVYFDYKIFKNINKSSNFIF